MKKYANMAYDRFSIMVSIQALGLAITPLLFYWLALKDYTLVTSVSLAVLWIFQIIFLIYYVRKTNKDIAGFLISVAHRDSSQKYIMEKDNKSFKELYLAFNEVFRTIREAKIKKGFFALWRCQKYFCQSLSSTGTQKIF